MTLSPSYGLARGRQWVAAPAPGAKLRRAMAAATTHGLICRRTGEPLWLPGLTLGGPFEAWLTPDLGVAMERQRLLALRHDGWATSVRRIP